MITPDPSKPNNMDAERSERLSLQPADISELARNLAQYEMLACQMFSVADIRDAFDPGSLSYTASWVLPIPFLGGGQSCQFSFVQEDGENFRLRYDNIATDPFTFERFVGITRDETKTLSEWKALAESYPTAEELITKNEAVLGDFTSALRRDE